MIYSHKKGQRGMTLLELMFAMGILTALMGVLFSLSVGIGDTAKLQDVKVQNNDGARQAILAVVPRLRQAQASSINVGNLPGDVLTFQMPADVDGNGTAVNVSGALEVGSQITIQRDTSDVNQDGLNNEQLIMIQDDVVTVLVNNLSPDAGPAPVADGGAPPENTAGFWVERQGGGFLLTIRTQGETRRGTLIRQQFTELVNPRN